MLRIGENLNVISTELGAAMKEMNPDPIKRMALDQAEKKVDFIDINIGPARKNGPELMEWIVKTVQEVVPDIPLALDTSNVEAIEAGLKVHKGKALINSIMARQERMDALIPLAAKYNAACIALLWGPQGMPRDENERSELTVTLLSAILEAGVAPEDIYLDPIATPVCVQQDQVKSMFNFMMMLPDLSEALGASGLNSTCGLSNTSNGTPDHLRPIINQTSMVILEKYGMTSAIVDAFDDRLTALCKGEFENIKKIILDVTDGKEVDQGSLSKEEIDYLKTAKVILGHSLYSDSWLEI
ncbi:MAG: dihydropteroate synthase [Thermodesulfobacteriota bacterium]|nr:dihydropteroate synthase [Thermodesulfobacteriota bacterium]